LTHKEWDISDPSEDLVPQQVLQHYKTLHDLMYNTQMWWSLLSRTEITFLKKMSLNLHSFVMKNQVVSFRDWRQSR